jgi:hypothetical protein
MQLPHTFPSQGLSQGMRSSEANVSEKDLSTASLALEDLAEKTSGLASEAPTRSSCCSSLKGAKAVQCGDVNRECV